VGGVTFVAASGRADAVRLEPVAEPGALVFPGTKRLTYRLRIFGEEREERFVVGIYPPRFGGLADDAEGVLVRLASTGRIVFGDATPVSSGYVIALPPLCRGYHGFEPSGIVYEIIVPPRSFSEIVVPAEVTRTPPWVDSDFRMTWTAENYTRTQAPPTLEREQTVRSPRAPLVRNAPGRTGVGLRIILRTKPRSASFSEPETPRLKRGRPAVIYGRTVPPVPGDRLKLITSGPGGKERPLATVRVDRTGRFRYRNWRPFRPGFHSIRALYPRQRPNVLADSACQRTLRVTR